MFYEWYGDGLGKTPTEAEIKASNAPCINAWKRANRPQVLNWCDTQTAGPATGGPLTAQPGGVTTLPAPSTQTGTVTQPGTGQTPGGDTDSSGDVMGGIGDFFSNIPPTLLYVGIAVAAFMVLKKR